MALAVDVAQQVLRIDDYLDYQSNMWNYLLEFRDQWDEMSDDERDDLLIEWPIVEDRLW